MSSVFSQQLPAPSSCSQAQLVPAVCCRSARACSLQCTVCSVQLVCAWWPCVCVAVRVRDVRRVRVRVCVVLELKLKPKPRPTARSPRQPTEQGGPRVGNASRSTGGLWWGGFPCVSGPLNAR
jgi:hypothetical protein